MDETELNEKIHLLKKYLEEGRLKFVKGMKVIESLKKVKYRADGKVNPDTVDTLVRSLASTVSFIDYRQELKKVPLLDVMREYYVLLEKFFQVPYEEMLKNSITPHEIASSVASNQKIVRAFHAEAAAFESGIIDFWEALGPIVSTHIEDLRCLKTIYGGDIFPNYQSNAISNTSLYIDTIIFPDPVLRCASFYKAFPIERAIYYLTKHALSVLSLKDVVLADINPPIAIIAPDSFHYDESTQEFVMSLGQKDLMTHLGYAFGREFKSDEELDIFLSNIKDIPSLKKVIADKDRILFDTDWKDLSLEEMWEKTKKYSLRLRDKSIGQQLGLTISGRMLQVNDLLVRSNQLGGTPFIDAPTSWQYFLWKYEYDQQISNAVNPELKNLLAIKALQADDLTWLGNVPYEAIVQLRKDGALHDIREMMTRGLGEIERVSEADFDTATDKVVSNINEALEKHNKELIELSSSAKKYFGYDITPWLTCGGLSIAAATTGNIPLSVSAAIAGMIGSPSVRELWGKGKDLLEDNKKIKRSPIGIFFEAKKKK